MWSNLEDAIFFTNNIYSSDYLVYYKMNKQEYRDKMIVTLKRAINDESVFMEFSHQVNDYMANFCTEYGRIKADDFITEIRSLYVDMRQELLVDKHKIAKNGLLKRIENMELVEDLWKTNAITLDAIAK